jgi:transposase InsO family protein
VAAIKKLSASHDVKLLCRIYGVSRSTYYAAVSRPASRRSVENAEIKAKIVEIHEGSKKRYGCVKITHALARQGVKVSQGRVLRLMRELGAKSVVRYRCRKRKPSTDDVERENQLKRQFHADRPNQIWLTDITYIKTVRDGWTYLAVVLDMCSRKAAGWSYGRSMTAQLALDALLAAHRNQGHPKDVLLHSDQGSQYTSELVTHTATRLGMRLSHSPKGSPIDNSPMEAFNAILKKELIYTSEVFADFDSAKPLIFDFIEGFYNRTRIHGSIGFMAPAEFESRFVPH